MNGGSAISITDPGEAVTLSGDTFVGKHGSHRHGRRGADRGPPLPRRQNAADGAPITTRSAPSARATALATVSGGAVAVWGSSAPLQITNNTFVGELGQRRLRPRRRADRLQLHRRRERPGVGVVGQTRSGAAPPAPATRRGTPVAAPTSSCRRPAALPLNPNHFIDNAISARPHRGETRGPGGA